MKRRVLGACLLSLLAPPLWAEDALPYALTEPQGFSSGRVDARSHYDNKARGSLDSEPMAEVSPRDTGPGLPAPYIVPYAVAPQATEILIGPARRPAPPSGEDRVFEQIRAEPRSAYLEALQQQAD
ncbi:hypothetical protein [Marinobacterium rhizophilum]|uniref:DUF4148 domain-containing protein n=1 Tax=Marinobacterium rhizophilum TaxID=420402 RepID=A0ABY5HNP4_9GAMM|nr:hypothetical protein [Marinobacterium rhizophilum]UTW14067.1 hypothetical protein KDW95_10700 [Marinobacterium rhizophilum]